MTEIKKPIILVVDDVPENISLLAGILNPLYKVKAAKSGKLALSLANAPEQPDLILLDVMMPEMDGYEVCRRLKSSAITEKIPVIFVTAKDQEDDEQKGFDLGAVDYITKPISPALVKARVKAQLSLYSQAQHLEHLVLERTQELHQTRLEIIRRLGKAAEFKDNETGMHVIRMSWFSRFLAEQIGQPEHWCELLFQAAPMHDIGKIGIPDAVLLKPGRLDEAEWQVMKQHAQIGADILGEHDSAIMQMAKEVAITHHEKWNGEGYPNGLKGEEIPLSGRIVAIADVFDALTSERPYKKAWSESEALALLQNEAGKHFDPNLIEPFIACLDKVRKIQKQFSDELE